MLEDVQRQGGVERTVGEREVLADAEDVGRRVADDLEVHDVLVHRRLEAASRVEDEAVGMVFDDLHCDRVVTPRGDVVGVDDAGAGGEVVRQEVVVLRVV